MLDNGGIVAPFPQMARNDLTFLLKSKLGGAVLSGVNKFPIWETQEEDDKGLAGHSSTSSMCFGA